MLYQTASIICDKHLLKYAYLSEYLGNLWGKSATPLGHVRHVVNLPQAGSGELAPRSFVYISGGWLKNNNTLSDKTLRTDGIQTLAHNCETSLVMSRFIFLCDD